MFPTLRSKFWWRENSFSLKEWESPGPALGNPTTTEERASIGKTRLVCVWIELQFLPPPLRLSYKRVAVHVFFYFGYMYIYISTRNVVVWLVKVDWITRWYDPLLRRFNTCLTDPFASLQQYFDKNIALFCTAEYVLLAGRFMKTCYCCFSFFFYLASMTLWLLCGPKEMIETRLEKLHTHSHTHFLSLLPVLLLLLLRPSFSPMKHSTHLT